MGADDAPSFIYAGSTIIQAIVEVSVPSLEVIVKLVAGVLAVTPTGMGAPTVPRTCMLKKILEFAVTSVVDTTAAPPDNATEPRRAFAPSLMFTPFPAVFSTRSPFVAVIAPRVAVSVVPAVTLVVASRAPA